MGIGADDTATPFGSGWGSQSGNGFGGMGGAMGGGSDFNPMMSQQGMQQSMGQQSMQRQGMQSQGMQSQGMQRQGFMGMGAMGNEGGRVGPMGHAPLQDDMHVLVGDDDGMDIDALLTNMDAAGQRDGFVSVQ